MAVSGEGKGRGLLLFSSFWCSTERGSARGSLSFTSSGPNWVGRWGVVVSATEAVGLLVEVEVDEVTPGTGDVLGEQPVAGSAFEEVEVVVSIFCCCGCPCGRLLLALAMEV